MKQRGPKLLRCQWLTGALCLLVYLCGGSGTLAEVCAMATALDQSHQPMVGVREKTFVLVLTHPKNDSSRPAAPSHRHGIVAGFLCVLAKQNPAQKDHWLEFASCGVSENPQGKLKVAALTTMAPATVVFPMPLHEAVLLPLSHESPPLPHSLLSTCVTVLLV